MTHTTAFGGCIVAHGLMAVFFHSVEFICVQRWEIELITWNVLQQLIHKRPLILYVCAIFEDGSVGWNGV